MANAAPIRIHDEVATALREGRPVVALETAVLTHGLPREPAPELTAVANALWQADAPANLALARAMERAVREAGAWETWTPQRVQQARADGRPVFVDFTAAWCVSCQANKKLVLEREAVVAQMTRYNVLRLRADWTQRDPAITAELARHGRNGVPLYLLYDPAGRAPRVLPEILTVGIVTEALGALPPKK